jgi:hypothetical protein
LGIGANFGGLTVTPNPDGSIDVHIPKLM